MRQKKDEGKKRDRGIYGSKEIGRGRANGKGRSREMTGTKGKTAGMNERKESKYMEIVKSRPRTEERKEAEERR